MHGAVAPSVAVKVALVKGTGALSLAGMGPVLSLWMARRLKRNLAKINQVAQKMQGWDLGGTGLHAPKPAILRAQTHPKEAGSDLARKPHFRQTKLGWPTTRI